MTLEQKIQEDIKQSMLAKETVRLSALRAVKAAILLEKTSGAAHDVSDADIIKIMQKLVKQRRESAEIYINAGRGELAEQEIAEASFIEEYLPKQLTAEELEARLRGIIAELGIQSPAEIGKVMGAATKQLAGLADGRQISETVKKILNG